MLGQEKVYIFIEKKKDVERSAPKTSTGFGQDVAHWRRGKRREMKETEGLSHYFSDVTGDD